MQELINFSFFFPALFQSGHQHGLRFNIRIPMENKWRKSSFSQSKSRWHVNSQSKLSIQTVNQWNQTVETVNQTVDSQSMLNPSKKNKYNDRFDITILLLVIWEHIQALVGEIPGKNFHKILICCRHLFHNWLNCIKSLNGWQTQNNVFRDKRYSIFLFKKASLKNIPQFTCCVEFESTCVQIVNQSWWNRGLRRSCLEKVTFTFNKIVIIVVWIYFKLKWIYEKSIGQLHN